MHLVLQVIRSVNARKRKGGPSRMSVAIDCGQLATLSSRRTTIPIAYVNARTITAAVAAQYVQRYALASECFENGLKDALFDVFGLFDF